MNQLIQYPLPQWLSILFLIAIPLPFILIVLFVKKQESPNGNLYKKIALFFILYLAYTFGASQLGWFNAISFPPRVLLFTTFPFALFLFLVVAKLSSIQSIINNASTASLVQLHIFRLVGVFFILLATHNSLPKGFAMIAGIGDMLTAITSIYVAKQLLQNKPNAQRLTFIWNCFGTVDILFTAIVANVLTKLSMTNGSMGVDTLARFPFCIIPAFAPPVILFLHWLIFKKLNKNT